MAVAKSWVSYAAMMCATLSSTLKRTIANGSQVYLNIVLDEALEEKPGGVRDKIGMVVIRGNAVVMLEVRITNLPKQEPAILI